MKKIEAIIKPFKIDEVKIALEEVGVRGMTILDAQGRGRQRGFTEMNTGVEYGDFLPKVKLEVIVEDDLVDKSIDAIIKSTNTNRIGDGKIFVSNIEKVLIRNIVERNPLNLFLIPLKNPNTRTVNSEKLMQFALAIDVLLGF